MREGGEQLLASSFLVAQVGDVLQPENQSRRCIVAGAKRRRSQNVGVLSAAQEERDLDALAFALGVRQIVPQGRAHAQVVRVSAGEILESLAEHAGALDLQDGARHLVDVDDHAARVEHDQAVLDGLDHRFGLRLLRQDASTRVRSMAMAACPAIDLEQLALLRR